jgi:hypothetical protein
VASENSNEVWGNFSDTEPKMNEQNIGQSPSTILQDKQEVFEIDSEHLGH